MLRTGQFTENSKHYIIGVILILQILAPAWNSCEGSFIPLGKVTHLLLHACTFLYRSIYHLQLQLPMHMSALPLCKNVRNTNAII